MIRVTTSEQKLNKSYDALQKEATTVIKESTDALSVFQITVDDLNVKNAKMKGQVKLIEEFEIKLANMKYELTQKIQANKGVVQKITDFLLPAKLPANSRERVEKGSITKIK